MAHKGRSLVEQIKAQRKSQHEKFLKLKKDGAKIRKAAAKLRAATAAKKKAKREKTSKGLKAAEARRKRNK